MYEAGTQASSGGRRAMALCADGDSKYAAGIDITKNHIDFALINLRGAVIANERLKIRFAKDEVYGEQVQELFYQFLRENHINTEKMVGMGVALPGIVSIDQQTLERSHILEIEKPLELKRIKQLSCPIHFFNDATAACMAECYRRTTPDSFTFFSLRNSVGGATVIENKIVEGKSGRNGELGHMCIVQGGRMCYCGKRGHYDSYGSALRLSDMTNGSLEEFFRRVSEGEKDLVRVFDEYMDYLAMMIYNIHIISDLPVVIGGYVGKYLEPYVGLLKEKTEKYNIFEEKEEYIFISYYGLEAAAVGAARYQIERFIEAL